MSTLIIWYNRFSENEAVEGHIPRHWDSKTKKSWHQDSTSKKLPNRDPGTKTPPRQETGSRFQGIFSEDKKPQHWDSKTEKPWHRDSKKPWHWVSAEFWPLFLLIVGGRQMPKNNGSVGITDYIYYSEQITQKWGSEDVCPNENSWYCEHSVKNQRGKDRRPNFAIFVVWSALIVGS